MRVFLLIPGRPRQGISENAELNVVLDKDISNERLETLNIFLS